MPTDYLAWAEQVKRLHRWLAALAPIAERVGVPPPSGLDWFELLEHKLLPQLETRPLLVVAVVGGTNIGKSVLFNHLTGEEASAVSPLAAGTKHPVCLVPPRTPPIRSCSPGSSRAFGSQPWQSADDSLPRLPGALPLLARGRERARRGCCCWTRPTSIPTSTVNWQRARAIRQAADVLVAVLTQQKYNDAAVKQFFREAVAGRQADRRRVQPVRPGGRPPLLAAVAGDVLPARPAPGPSWSTSFPAIAGRRPSRGCRFIGVGPDGRLPPERAVEPARRAGRASLRRDQDPHVPRRARPGARCRNRRRRVPGDDPRGVGRVPGGGRGAVRHRDGPGGLADACRPACWSTRSATGGTPAGPTGRATSTVSTACWARA